MTAEAALLIELQLGVRWPQPGQYAGRVPGLLVSANRASDHRKSQGGRRRRSVGDVRNTSTCVSIHLYSRSMRSAISTAVRACDLRSFRDFDNDDQRRWAQPESLRPRASRLLVRSGVPLLLDHLAVDPGDRKGARYPGPLPCYEPGRAERGH